MKSKQLWTSIFFIYNKYKNVKLKVEKHNKTRGINQWCLQELSNLSTRVDRLHLVQQCTACVGFRTLNKGTCFLKCKQFQHTCYYSTFLHIVFLKFNCTDCLCWFVFITALNGLILFSFKQINLISKCAQLSNLR